MTKNQQQKPQANQQGQQQPNNGGQAQQQPEAERIRDRKRKVIDTLQTKFSEEIWRERLLKICGGDESRIMKSLQSFITYVMQDDGGKEGREKKYIADCSLSSITAAFLESFQMGIEVGGGRDHAYLVNYAGQCELDISYKGFVYALGKHFDNPFVIAENVFEGDEFTSHITDTTATYSHKPKDPFKKTWETLRGCYCYFSYTQRDSKEKVSRLVMIQRDGPDGLDMIRSKSKGSFAWKDFPFEQTKKSTCRRASKIPFAQIDFGDEDVNPETVDNRHYELENKNPADRIKQLMDASRDINADENAKADRGTAAGTAAPHDSGGSAPAGADAPAGNGKQEILPPDNNNNPAGAQPLTTVNADQEENESGFQDIDDADFGDPAEGAPVVIENEPPAKAQTVAQAPPAAESPSPSPAASGEAVAVLPAAQEDGAAWDGKTLLIGGKAQARDFPTSSSAMIYLKKVITHRKHKASRLSIINENPKLMAALIKDGQGSAIAELHKLADQGE